jgi:NADH dehydrogenase subunit N (EC 1.6.5.3)
MLYGATGSLDLVTIFRMIAVEPINRAVLVLGVVFIVQAGVQARSRALPHVDSRRLSGRATAWC